MPRPPLSTRRIPTSAPVSSPSGAQGTPAVPAPPAPGNQQTLRALGVTPDPLAAEAESRAKAEVSDLAKLGTPVPEQPSLVDVGGEGTKIELGRRNLFHVTVSAGGANGKVESTTDFTLHRDPQQRYVDQFVGPAGPPTDVVVDIEGKWPGGLAPVRAVEVYPIILKYERTLRLTDREGRNCEVGVGSTLQFSYATWEAATAGRTPSLETLQSLEGDTALTVVSLYCEGPVKNYSAHDMNDERTINAAVAVAQAQLEGDRSLRDAAGLPMTFVRTGETAGSQFAALEAVLKRLDEKELERRAKARAASLGGSEEDLPPSVRGTLSTLEKALLGIMVVLGAAAVIAALPFEIGFGAAVLWIGASLLAASFLNSLISRVREAVHEGVRNPLSILSASVLDTVGVGALYESFTDRSLLTGRELGRTEEERWESGTTGALNFILTMFGVRSAAKSYRPRPEPVTDAPPQAPPGRPPPEDHPGMDLWTEGHDPSPQVVTRLSQARCSIGEQGVAFAGYPHREGWAFIDGPSGAGGHAWNAPGFDGVAFRTRGPLEIEIIDNKAFASQGNVSSSSALTRNLQTNLRDLGAQIADPVYDAVPRIADVRNSVATARTALQNGTPLPAEVRLVVTNFGGRSSGVTSTLQGLGIVFRDSN